MNVENLISKYIAEISDNVFSTMLGVELGAGEPFRESGTPEPNDGVVAFIGLAGAWTGAGTLSCTPALACRVCSQMLMTETPAVNEDVLDAVAELTNMIIGGVKTDLEQHLGPLGLSIPTVVFGRNFRTRSSGTSEWVAVRFAWDGEPLVVKICLAPSERPAFAAAHLTASASPVDL